MGQARRRAQEISALKLREPATIGHRSPLPAHAVCQFGLMMDLFHHDVHADPVTATMEERYPAFERIFLKYESLSHDEWISRLSAWVLNIYYADRRDGHCLLAHACSFRQTLDLFHQDFHSQPVGDRGAFAEAVKAWEDFDGLTRDECIGVLGDLILQVYQEERSRQRQLAE